MKPLTEELALAAAAEVARSGAPGTSVEYYGLVPAIGAVVDAQLRYRAMAMALQDGIRSAIADRDKRSARVLRSLLDSVAVFWTADWTPQQ